MRGVDVVNELKKRNIDYIELINSTNTTRMAAGALANVLNYLSDPSSPLKLSKAYQVWRRDWRDEESSQAPTGANQSPADEEIDSEQEALLAMTQTMLYNRTPELLRKTRFVEQYLSPTGFNNTRGHFDELTAWLFSLSGSDEDLAIADELFASAKLSAAGRLPPCCRSTNSC